MRTAKKQNIALNDKLFIHQEQRHQQQLDEDIRMARINQVLKTNTVHQQQQEHHRRTTEIDQQQQNVASDLITPVILERATASMRVSPPQNNFDVLIRVLEEPDYLGGKVEKILKDRLDLIPSTSRSCEHSNVDGIKSMPLHLKPTTSKKIHFFQRENNNE